MSFSNTTHIISNKIIRGIKPELNTINALKKADVIIDFTIPKRYKKFIVYKGSVTINGVSLTVAKILVNGFQISIIPKTLKLTNLINLKEKNLVNVEFDVLGKYIKSFIK